jgi:hypothetical protein
VPLETGVQSSRFVRYAELRAALLPFGSDTTEPATLTAAAQHNDP